jgi:diacylglycerol kinase (ATP)
LATALVLVNRKSREGLTELDAGLALLRGEGLAVIEEYVEEPAQIPEVIRRRKDQVERVLLGGGDGTLSTACEALLESGLPMGILPLGTGNDLARTLGIPLELSEAFRVAAAGRVERIDLGWVNGKHFLNAAGIGLGVRVAGKLSPEVKRRWGAVSYALAILSAFRENRSFRATLTCEDRPRRLRTIHVTVANGRHYGGGITVAADASIRDHRLDLFSIAPAPFWKLLLLAPALRRGLEEARPGILLLSCREVRVTTERPLPVTADGEVVTRTPASFRVVPEALPVFVPAQPRSGGSSA